MFNIIFSLSFLTGVFFLSKEFLVINYELIIIIGVLIIFSIILKQLKNPIEQGLDSYQNVIREKLQALLLIKVQQLVDQNFLKNVLLDVSNIHLDNEIQNFESTENIETYIEGEILNINNNILNLNAKVLENY